jgi:hypothetical protein
MAAVAAATAALAARAAGSALIVVKVSAVTEWNGRRALTVAAVLREQSRRGHQCNEPSMSMY